jgi:hypothetical protein
MLPESLNDALVEAVKACGGSKRVGVALWPTRGVEGAQRHLLACLNPDRNERLSPDDVMLLERQARDRGCHVIAEYRNAVLSYAPPVAIQPRDEADQLRREAVESMRRLQATLARIETLEAVANASEVRQ